MKNIDVKSKTVTTSYETIPYDKLVIAAGSTNNFFNMEGMDQKGFTMKTVSEAIRMRDEILDRLERGAMEKDPERRRQLLSFLVIGGGPSGVEIAGAIGEMKKDILPREYPELKPDDLKITIVEGTDRLLGPLGPEASRKAIKYLNQLFLSVKLNTLVKSYDNKIVTFADGTSEYCETVVWTAGVKGTPMPGLPEETLEHNGRIKVDLYNRVIGLDNVFAIGDIAEMACEGYPKGHPQLAQPALQQGKNLARNMNGDEFRYAFKYHDKGSMATVGKNRAVVVLGKTTFGGYPAWLAWMFIHLISILGMRNRLMVLINWMWNYMTYSTSLRLLIRPTRFPERKHWGD